MHGKRETVDAMECQWLLLVLIAKSSTAHSTIHSRRTNVIGIQSGWGCAGNERFQVTFSFLIFSICFMMITVHSSKKRRRWWKWNRMQWKAKANDGIPIPCAIASSRHIFRHDLISFSIKAKKKKTKEKVATKFRISSTGLPSKCCAPFCCPLENCNDDVGY